MTRTSIGLTLFGSLLAVAACADPTSPPRAAAKTAPRTAVQTRYILASGDVMPPGCTDLGNGLWLCEESGEAVQGVAQPATATSAGDDNDAQN